MGIYKDLRIFIPNPPSFYRNIFFFFFNKKLGGKKEILIKNPYHPHQNKSFKNTLSEFFLSSTIFTFASIKKRLNC